MTIETIFRQRAPVFRAILVAVGLLLPGTGFAFEASGLLEIHYINVGQGGGTLMIGPDGTRLLYDFGDRGRGHPDDPTRAQAMVDYLGDGAGIAPEDGLHYSFVSHRDRDHYFGFKTVTEAGYDVLVANFDPGSDKGPTSLMKSRWMDHAENTTAGPVTAPPIGLRIHIGDGAEVMVVARNGRVFGREEPLPVPNENDRSLVLFVRYGNFEFILDGDLGGGAEGCTAHDTSQRNIQVPVAESLIAQGLVPDDGIDVMHVSHHGSESSTPAAYYNLLRPKVGLISVGLSSAHHFHPREDVVDKVLLQDPGAPDCVAAPKLDHLFQTEEGVEGGTGAGATSFLGTALGNIKLVTDGRAVMTITGDGQVSAGSRQDPPASLGPFVISLTRPPS